jgi:malonyl-CoA O-methyltransferase
MRLALRLTALGLDVRAVRPPTVPEGTSRLRLAFHAYNSDKCVAALQFTLQEELSKRLGDPSCKPSLKGPTRPERRSPSRLAARSEPRAERHARVHSALTLVLAIVGTDTCVGKTVVSALLARAAARSAERAAHGIGPRRPVVYWKPVQTGDESDTDTVAGLAAGLEVRCEPPALTFPLPASPHEAAAAAGGAIDVHLLRQRYAKLRSEAVGGTLLIEPAGGLLVPLDALHTQADLLAAERPGVVVVARSGLGTLNHTLLTLEALEARGLRPLALFLVGDPHRSNRDTLSARSSVPAVYELPPLEPLDAASLDSWLERYSLAPIFGEGA